MILTEFPDLPWLKHQIQTRFANQRTWDGRMLPDPSWPNVIINTKVSKAYRDNIKGPLSVFCNLSGKSQVTLEGRKLNIEKDSFLISNEDQNYTLEIDQKDQVETFNIHFGEAFLEKAFSSLTLSEDKLLDNLLVAERPLFINRIQQTDSHFIYLIARLKGAKNDFEQEEVLYQMFYYLVRSEQEVNHFKNMIPAIKKGSKNEILKRLLQASDYIHSYYNAPLSLEELSKVSNLSKFHFLRLFKSTYGITPYQFICKVRMKKATQLLMETKMEIREIAESVGFENPSSFSRLFYKESGFYPTQQRRRHN